MLERTNRTPRTLCLKLFNGLIIETSFDRITVKFVAPSQLPVRVSRCQAAAEYSHHQKPIGKNSQRNRNIVACKHKHLNISLNINLRDQAWLRCFDMDTSGSPPLPVSPAFIAEPFDPNSSARARGRESPGYPDKNSNPCRPPFPKSSAGAWSQSCTIEPSRHKIPHCRRRQ